MNASSRTTIHIAHCTKLKLVAILSLGSIPRPISDKLSASDLPGGAQPEPAGGRAPRQGRRRARFPGPAQAREHGARQRRRVYWGERAGHEGVRAACGADECVHGRWLRHDDVARGELACCHPALDSLFIDEYVVQLFSVPDRLALAKAGEKNGRSEESLVSTLFCSLGTVVSIVIVRATPSTQCPYHDIDMSLRRKPGPSLRP